MISDMSLEAEILSNHETLYGSSSRNFASSNSNLTSHLIFYLQLLIVFVIGYLTCISPLVIIWSIVKFLYAISYGDDKGDKRSRLMRGS